MGKKKQRFKSFLKWSAITLVTTGTIGALGGFLYVNNKLSTLPDIDTQYLTTYGNSKIVDADGNIIWQTTQSYSKSTTFEEIEQTLIDDAIINVEDEDFYKNKGFSYKAVANMIFGYIYSKINSNYEARGGSTIDQQVIKNAYYNGGIGHDTFTRKIQELYLSKQLDENYNKQEIFDMYVNMMEYSEGAKGLAAIAELYFGKSLDQYKERSIENIAQQAYLAGLGQAPTTYNLYDNPEEAHKRMKTVLGVLLEKGVITQDEYNQAKEFDLTTTLKPRYWKSEEQRQQNLKYKTYTDMVLSDVKNLGYNIEDLTVTIHTFLKQETFDAITNKVRESAYYQDGEGGTEQVAATVIDKDGIVIGMVGSRYEGDELNRAIQQVRSSGSSMKPFTAYGPLFQYFGNKYNTASVFSTSPYLYPGTNVYMNNYDGYTYGNQTAQYSLWMSLNTPVARIADEILGPNRMKTFLNGLGLDVQQSYSSVDAIGLNISTLQAAAAYNAVNNKGIYTEPRFIDYIEFTDGSTKKIEAKHRKAMNESTAFVLSQMLRGVVKPGYSGRDAAINAYEGYGGKTGSVALDETSGAYNYYGAGGSDIWYDSITNGGYSVSVWFGYDKPNESPQLSDNFEGHQWLGRDLQLMLNGDRAVPNWEQPATVRNIGGSGWSAHYAITDPQDIGNENSSVVVDPISDLYSLSGLMDAKAETTAKDNWANSLVGNEKRIYDLYKTDNSLFDKLNIIDSDLYNRIR